MTAQEASAVAQLEQAKAQLQQTQADLYLLTDQPLNTSALGAMVGQSAVGQEVPGAPGLRMAFQESMNASLFHDLSTDKNMGWVPTSGWLSFARPALTACGAKRHHAGTRTRPAGGRRGDDWPSGTRSGAVSSGAAAGELIS